MATEAYADMFGFLKKHDVELFPDGELDRILPVNLWPRLGFGRWWLQGIRVNFIFCGNTQQIKLHRNPGLLIFWGVLIAILPMSKLTTISLFQIVRV